MAGDSRLCAVPRIPRRFIQIPGVKGESPKTYKLNKQQYYEYSKLVGRYRYIGAPGKMKRVDLNTIKKQINPGVYQLVSSKYYMGDDYKTTLSNEQILGKLKSIYRTNASLALTEFLRRMGPNPSEKMEEIKKPSGQMLENSDRFELSD